MLRQNSYSQRYPSQLTISTKEQKKKDLYLSEGERRQNV